MGYGAALGSFQRSGDYGGDYVGNRAYTRSFPQKTACVFLAEVVQLCRLEGKGEGGGGKNLAENHN